MTCELSTIQLGDSMKSGGLSDEGEDDLDMADEDLKMEDDDDDDSIPMEHLSKPKLEPDVSISSANPSAISGPTPTSTVGLMVASNPATQPVAMTNGTGIVWIASAPLLGLPQPTPPPPPLYSIKQLNNTQVINYE